MSYGPRGLAYLASKKGLDSDMAVLTISTVSSVFIQYSVRAQTLLLADIAQCSHN